MSGTKYRHVIRSKWFDGNQSGLAAVKIMVLNKLRSFDNFSKNDRWSFYEIRDVSWFTDQVQLRLFCLTYSNWTVYVHYRWCSHFYIRWEIADNHSY